MLLELRAENYAIIDRATANFGPGLNLLSGETGAGKSILVDALALLLGGKASPSIVRHGAERAIVSCAFESTPAARTTLDANGIDADGDQIILRREIQSSGKGRVFVNNQPATANLLRQLAPDLALVHSQGETLAAFDQAQQRILLDRYAALSAQKTAAAYKSWRQAVTELDELEAEERDQARQSEMWEYSFREIEAARIAPPQQDGKTEDELLETEKRVLANAEKLYAAAMSAYEWLYEGGQSAEAALKAAQRNLEELSRYDARFSVELEQLASARAIVSDVGAGMRDYASGIQASPDRLTEIEDRLAHLDRLKRKYGKTLAEVSGYGEQMRQKLARLENHEAILQELRQTRDRAAESYRAAAAGLTSERRVAAEKLSKLVAAHLADLALDSKFDVGITPCEEEAAWAPDGWDTVQYRIATNPGEPLQPLTEIASGGEMSRVMLALKVAVEEGLHPVKKTRKNAPLPRTLIFDEIDIGIGGRAAEAVGKKLRTLSRGQQVLCVTHLPQIAAFATQHLLVEKTERRGRTETSVRLLSTAGRKEEIARMLSGATLTDTSLRHAEQMLKAGRESA